MLDARAAHTDATLADLYDPIATPQDLLRAHQRLDAAVDKAYETVGGKKKWRDDAERMAFLFDLYQRITTLLPSAKASTIKRMRSQRPDAMP